MEIARKVKHTPVPTSVVHRSPAKRRPKCLTIRVRQPPVGRRATVRRCAALAAKSAIDALWHTRAFEPVDGAVELNHIFHAARLVEPIDILCDDPHEQSHLLERREGGMGAIWSNAVKGGEEGALALPPAVGVGMERLDVCCLGCVDGAPQRSRE